MASPVDILRAELDKHTWYEIADKQDWRDLIVIAFSNALAAAPPTLPASDAVEALMRLHAIASHLASEITWEPADDLNMAHGKELHEAVQQAESVLAMHASAPPGYKCADCTIDGKACEDCRAALAASRAANNTNADTKRTTT